MPSAEVLIIFMRRILFIAGFSVLLFVVLTCVTASIETPSDGNDTFGFPFRFYKIYGGKRSFYPPNEFSVVMMLLDVVIATLVVWIGNVTFIKLRTKNENA